jgi:hypothetical protein
VTLEVASSAETPFATCIACRHANPADARFCNQCGHALGAPVGEVVSPAAVRLDPSWRDARAIPAASAASARQDPSPAQGAMLQPPHSDVAFERRRTFDRALRGVAVVAVVALALAGGDLYMTRPDDGGTAGSGRSTGVMAIEPPPAIALPEQPAPTATPASVDVRQSGSDSAAGSHATESSARDDASRSRGASTKTTPGPSCSESVDALGLCDASGGARAPSR